MSDAPKSIYPDTSGQREKVASEIETVGWAILQALHEGVEDGPQSWSDMASDQEKRIKKAAIAAIEAVTDLAQFNAQGFSWPPQPLAPAQGSGDCGEAREKEITRLATIEECAQVAEAEKLGFLSPEYASNQPFGSLCERFACDQVAEAIRALAVPSTSRGTEA